MCKAEPQKPDFPDPDQIEAVQNALEYLSDKDGWWKIDLDAIALKAGVSKNKARVALLVLRNLNCISWHENKIEIIATDINK